MPSNQAVVTAVLRTLVRATLDERALVVLRTRDAVRARELGGWLAMAHGSSRRVIASPTARGEIEVRLPRQMQWPLPVSVAGEPTDRRGLADVASMLHLSGMPHPQTSHAPR